MKEEKLKKIVIDSRERHLIDFFNQKTEKLVALNVQQLDVGDVIISDVCAIERKDGFDYVVSLIDNRLFEQLLRLREAYEYPILIVEGLNQFVFDNVNVKLSSIYGSLAKIIYKLQINIVYTANLEHTVFFIERLATQIYSENLEESLVVRSAPKKLSPEERRVYIVEGLIECGSKKAKMLIDRFKTPFEVIMAIKNTKIIYTRTGKPKGISGPLEELAGFGFKFVEKNQDILFNSNQELSNNQTIIIQHNSKFKDVLGNYSIDSI